MKETQWRILQVDATSNGQRLDNYLIKHHKKIPKSRLYRAIRTAQVKVNGKKARSEVRLQAGDQIRLPVFVDHISTVKTDPKQIVIRNQRLISNLLANIVYEDDLLMVLNKPAGLSVHGGSMVGLGVIEIMRAALPELSYLELVHRIDKQTSGCLMLAKNREALVALHKGLADKTIDKTYLALVAGRWSLGTTELELPMSKMQMRDGSGERVMVTDEEDSREAITWFSPKQFLGDLTLLEVKPKTGKTHQIRVHAAHLGYPIIGDTKYGDRLLNRAYKKHGCDRMFLHAHKLQLPQHWFDKQKSQTITAPLEKKLTELIQRLAKKS